MLFAYLPQIDDADVSVRPIDERDLRAWAALVCLPEIQDCTSWNLSSEEELRPCVWRPGEDSAFGPLRFAISLHTSNQLVGTIGFHSVTPSTGSAELGYELHPAVWGRGIATRICGALTDWGHEAAQLLRIQAAVLVSNQRSIRVLERCSFQREGVQSLYRKVRGVPSDYYMYSHVESGTPPYPSLTAQS